MTYLNAMTFLFTSLFISQPWRFVNRNPWSTAELLATKGVSINYVDVSQHYSCAESLICFVIKDNKYSSASYDIILIKLINNQSNNHESLQKSIHTNLPYNEKALTYIILTLRLSAFK